ncbi:trypco2 family protein [Streptomyces sp. NPDC051001]|uniref:trypco2 family protein n=1 Tax=Streptomyces sp. NPDC051001 TaxID=3155795 RepID=UPI0034242230
MKRYARCLAGCTLLALLRGAMFGGKMSEDHEGVELASAVQSLRDELLAAAVQGADTAIRFAVESIELEFTVQLSKDITGKAGVKAWVLTAGADVTQGRADTQRVKLTLTPKDAATGRTLEIGSIDHGGAAAFTRATPSAGSGL